MEQWSDPDPGSGIKHPGSATLVDTICKVKILRAGAGAKLEAEVAKNSTVLATLANTKQCSLSLVVNALIIVTSFF
jgi:hypothetical protein